MEGLTENSLMNPKLLKLTEENEANRCFFCRKSALNELEWGVMYQLDDIVVHYFCLLFCPPLYQRGQDHEGILGFLLPDIKKELRRGTTLKCKYCKLKGATVGCAVAKCREKFHLPCGISNGTHHQFSGFFDSYCCTHKPNVIIDAPEEIRTCGICFIRVEESENYVRPPCCKNVIYHRLCMQRYASTSGSYFFSCPHCKNTDAFVESMKNSGVYVPIRDAEWELEPGAFEELGFTYSHCDAKLCFCRHGRDHGKSSSRRWRILKCDLCGSAAIHAFCGKISDENSTWWCPDCSEIVSEGRRNSFSRAPQRAASTVSSSDYLSIDEIEGFSQGYKRKDKTISSKRFRFKPEHISQAAVIAAETFSAEVHSVLSDTGIPPNCNKNKDTEVLSKNIVFPPSDSDHEKRCSILQKPVLDPYNLQNRGNDQSESVVDRTSHSFRLINSIDHTKPASVQLSSDLDNPGNLHVNKNKNKHQVFGEDSDEDFIPNDETRTEYEGQE